MVVNGIMVGGGSNAGDDYGGSYGGDDGEEEETLYLQIIGRVHSSFIQVIIFER